ncbi:MAG: hypothetical protein AAFN94_02110 [Pseudomonadota bacterium]
MPLDFDPMKVPENIKEAAADTTEAHHIYRNYLKSRQVVEWFNMCVDAQRRMAPQQFFFRYLMRDYQGMSANIELADPNAHLFTGGRRPKVTENWTLNVSGAFFNEVGDAVERNDWSVATWEDFYDRCQNEAVSYENSNNFFTDFKKTHHYPKFVEAKLMSIYNRNRAGVLMELGLNHRFHSGILNHRVFPIALKYALTSAYLIATGHPVGQGMKNYGKSYFDQIGQTNQMPLTYDQFCNRLADY